MFVVKHVYVKQYAPLARKYRRILATGAPPPFVYRLCCLWLDSMTTTPSFSLGILDDMLGFRLRRANAAALRQLDAALAEQGLTTAMFGTLEVLASNEAVPQGVVAEALGLNRSTMVPI